MTQHDNPVKQYCFSHRGKPFCARLTADGTFELYLNDILRKDRPPQRKEPQYVWTNVELEWEEHHYVEARYWASTGNLAITINRQPFYEGVLGN